MTTERSGQLSRTFLCLLLAVMVFVTAFQEDAMAQDAGELQNAPYSYTITLTGENVFTEVNVNGAPLYLHGRMEPLLTTLPTTGNLQSGRNTITVEYEPYDMDLQSYTPHDGVLLQVKLERRTMLYSANPEENSIHLFSGKHDSAAGRMIASDDASVFGQGPLRRRDGGLRAGDVKLSDTTMVYGNRTSDGHAVRIAMDVFIEDPLLDPPPWADSPALADTPELRTELAERYRTLHGIVSANDEQGWRHEMRFVYAHLSKVLGYRDADAMADHVRRLIPLGAPEDEQISPLATDLEDGLLLFGSDQRLVKMSPNPVGFLTHDGQRVGGYGLTFCRIQQRLEICFMQDIPN
ncbi:MAG: hypothetical protein ACTIJY_00265 [Luteimonas sp.]